MAEQNSATIQESNHFMINSYSTLKYWSRILFLMLNEKFNTFKNRELFGDNLSSSNEFAVFSRLHNLISLIILLNILLGTLSYLLSTQPMYRYTSAILMNIHIFVYTIKKFY